MSGNAQRSHRAMPATTRRRSRRDVGAGIAAALTLLALIGGLPVVLLFVSGPPWPAHLPSAEQVGAAFLRPDNGQLLATVLIGIAWISWLVLTASLLIELVAHVTSRQPHYIPGLAGPQLLIGRLLAAAAVLTPATLSTPVAIAAPSPVVAAQTVAAYLEEPTSPAMPGPTQPEQHQHSVLRIYVVQPPHDGRRDALWSIAERYLGDPLRWHEIADLNRNRPQSDGSRLTDPHWIRPGWRLLMPADAMSLPLAEEAGPHVAAPIDPPTHALPRHLVETGAIPQPTAPAETSREQPPAVPIVHTPAEQRQNQHSTSHEESKPASDLMALGVLAAGLLAALTRLRIVQRRHRATGQRIRLPEASATKAEIRLRAAADPPRADLIARALSHLATTDPADASGVWGAELGDDTVTLLVDPPAEPPAPFTPGVAGQWQYDAAVRPCIDGFALPALASVGHIDGRLLFLDLERLGTLSIAGSPTAVESLLRWVTADLAAAPWSTTVMLTAAGLAPPLTQIDPERIHFVRAVDDELVSRFERHAKAYKQANGDRDAIATRMDPTIEPWPVELLVIGPAATAAANRQLVNRLVTATQTTRRSGCAVLIADPDIAARHRAVIDDTGHLTFSWTGLRIQAAQLLPATANDVAELLATATELTSEPTASPVAADTTLVPTTLTSEPGTPATTATWTPPTDEDDGLDAALDAYLSADPAVVRVQVLGSIDVKAPGPLEPKRLPTATELAVYLAFAQHGTTLSDVDEALWPERIVPHSTRNAVVSRTRAWLGTTTEGQPRLTRVDGNSRLHLHDVLVDSQLFERLVRRATRRSGPDRIADLQRALGLVDGRPFSGQSPGRYAWLAERHLEEELTATVIDAAHELAAGLLEAGDAHAAREVARTAQLVDQHDERPWRDLIRAEATLGRTRKVREHVRALMTLLDVEVADQLMPETAALIAEVLPARQTAAAS